MKIKKCKSKYQLKNWNIEKQDNQENRRKIRLLKNLNKNRGT